jgi:hypothetical protein
MELLIAALGPEQLMERIHTATDELPKRLWDHQLIHALNAMSERKAGVAR